MITSGPPSALKTATLLQLNGEVQTPEYDRSALPPHIVHIGVGGFHRAHQAVYLDDLLHQEGGEPYGICGIGLLPQDVRMGEALRAQDYLYTVVTRSATGDSARVIGSIIGFLHAPTDPVAVIDRMASPQTRIVSLTVTEAGYCENKATGQLDFDHPAVAQDLQRRDRPVGTYGFLAAALERRRYQGLPPFTVMSCDNLLNNGAVCRRMLLAFLERYDPTLAEWVADNGAFPNSMVDRITPATTDADRSLVRDRFGIVDLWPVVTEPFKQWVIEDHFPSGRPEWEAAGAQLVTDVEPYEKMKIRLLNGGHQVMCYIGMLLGYRYAPQAMADEQIHTLLRRFMDQEATPVVPSVPGIDLPSYKRTLLERFANPAINDQLGRIGTDGSARIAEFVLPTVADLLRRGGSAPIAAFTVAAWIRFLAGRDDTGAALPYSDPRGEALRERAREAGANASVILSIEDLFGELGRAPEFADAVNRALQGFYRVGARATLEQWLARESGGW